MILDKQTQQSLIFGGIAVAAIWYINKYKSQVAAGQLLAGNIAAKSAINTITEKFPVIAELIPEGYFVNENE